MEAMDEHARESGHVTAKQYYAMAECGIVSPDDRVELLDGLIVAMAPQSPRHAATVSRVHEILMRNLGPGVYVRAQSSLPMDDQCVPEPDVAVFPGTHADYFDEHPNETHLVVEVADSSVLQDRITKATIYARKGIPCYWLVNLRDHCVEVFRKPDRWKSAYTSVERRTGSQVCLIDAFPNTPFEAADLLPPRGVQLATRND
jgi:Uma2 family endonuclease